MHKRIPLLKLAVCLLATGWFATLSLAQISSQKEATTYQFKNDSTVVSIDRTHGTILAISDNVTRREIKAPEGFAGNYLLTLLNPDKTTTTIVGKDQSLTDLKDENGKLTLTWAGPLKDVTGMDHNIAVQMTIALKGREAAFSLNLTNHTAFKVREAQYPVVGGLRQWGGEGATLWAPTSYPWIKPLTAPFGNAAFGYPGQVDLSFTCVQNNKTNENLYISAQDTVARYKTYLFNEDSSKDITASVQFQPFTPPGKTFEGPPVALRFVKGDWQACGQVYREWFQKTFGITQPKDCWVRQQSFFLMTMFMLPEGTICMKFKDIPRWAKAAKSFGINAVQISGWQHGGHDNGYPDYTIDPRLGTLKELEDGIKFCHKLGMKVYFFVNYQQAMIDSDWYKNELHKYREMTADGGYTYVMGWGMGTLAARMGLNKNMTWLDPAFPEVRKIIVGYFTDLAKIGADGVHVDKMFPTAIEYNPDVPLSPDTAAWEGAIMLTQEVMASCRKYQPDWAMSFECMWDRVLQFTGATWWVGNQLITRKIFPENAETLGLYDAWDFLKVNEAVRNGHIVMVAPRNFTRGLDWPPFKDMANYIKDVKQIRDLLQDTVFFGEVIGQVGLLFEGDLPPGIEYGVFQNRTTGNRAGVITNNRIGAASVVLKAFEGKSSKSVRVWELHRKPYVVPLPVKIKVPGERLVFVEEVGGAK